MQIRPAGVDDAEELTRLHLEVWEAAYGSLMPAAVFAQRRAERTERIERWRGVVVESAALTTVAAEGDRLLGFASVGPSRDDDLPDLTELWALYVDVPAWGTGVGHRLLTETLGDHPALLWVLEGNERAIAFYRCHGFDVDGATEVEEGLLHLRMRRARPGPARKK